MMDDETPLHGAAEEGHVKVVQVLLANGADVRAKTRDGETPEDCAVAGGHAKVVALLRVSGGATQEREAVWQTGGLGRVS
ncbi:hypothetical protein T484DRAFT_1960477 [Baffinella frigidus]|nr:hypothetical protein T484DRAFT_1960477 [Cryptophyta sp. CCMP2293]